MTGNTRPAPGHHSGSTGSHIKPVVGEANGGVAAFELLHTVSADVVFMDIRMPQLDGFEVLERTRRPDMPSVVFVTAFDNHALRAFEHSAVDYILKPVDADRVRHALSRIRGRVGPPDRISFRDGARTLVLDVDEVEWVGAEDDYIRVHTRQRNYLIRETLSAFEQRVDSRQFLRIHRSTVVNVSRIRETSGTRDTVVVLRSGERLKVSRRYRVRLQRFMGTS